MLLLLQAGRRYWAGAALDLVYRFWAIYLHNRGKH